MAQRLEQLGFRPGLSLMGMRRGEENSSLAFAPPLRPCVFFPFTVTLTQFCTSAFSPSIRAFYVSLLLLLCARRHYISVLPLKVIKQRWAN